MVAHFLRHPRHALALALLLQILLFVVGQQDMPPDDPLYYAEFARDIAKDPAAAFGMASTYPWHMRIGLTLPLALLYRVFGVSTLVTNLPCLFAAIGILCVVYVAAPTPRAKVFAMLLAATCAPLARHAATLNVDLPCAALLACSTLWLSWRDRPRWLAAAMAVWFAAFLVKETAIWGAPIWAYAIISDLRSSSLRAVVRRYAPAVAIGAALSLGYLALCAALWGDPFARFRGIQDLTYAHGWTMHDKSSGEWFARLVWGPPLMMFKMFRGLLVPAVLAIWLVRGRDAIWGVATLAMVGLFWFGSSSATAYEPLPLWPRMILPALPFLLVVSAIAADRGLDRLTRGRSAAVIVMLVVLAVPATMMYVGQIRRDRSESTAFAMLRADLSDPAQTVVLVCGDRWFPTLARFHFGFAPPPNLLIIGADEVATRALPDRAVVRAIVDVARSAPIPDVEKIEALHLRPLFSQQHLRLYAVDDVAALRAALHP